MNVRRSKKVFLTMLLAMIAVFAMLGSAWAGPSISVIARDTSVEGNAGEVTVGSDFAVNVYYTSNGATVPAIKIPIEVTLAGTDSNATLTIDSPSSGVSIPSSAGLGNATHDILVTIDSQTTTPTSPLNIVFKVADTGGNDTKTLQVSFKKITITASPASLTFVTSKDYSAGVPVNITLGGTSPTAASYTSPLLFYRGSKTAQISATQDIWGPTASGVTAALTLAASALSPNRVVLSTPSSGATANQPQTQFNFYAANTTDKLTLDETAVSGIVVAGYDTSSPIAGFKAEVRGLIFLSSTDISLSTDTNYSATIDVIASDDQNVATGLDSLTIDGVTSTTWKDLTISTNTATKKISYSGKPSSAGSKTFAIVGKNSTAGTGYANLTITVTSAGTYSMTLNPDVFSTVVSKDVGTLTGTVVIKQGSTTVTPTPTLINPVISADSATDVTNNGTASVVWNGLTIAANTSGSVTIKGTPNVVNSSGKTFKLIATSSAVSGDLSATFTIKVNSSSTTGTISVTAPPTFYLNTPVASGTALTVTSSPQITALTIKKAGETVGGSSSTWNDLTFAVSSTNKISIAGTPSGTGSQTFTLTGTSSAGTVETSFTATIVKPGGSVHIDTNPEIYDENHNRIYTMTVGELMTMLFGTNIDLSALGSGQIGVYVTRPGGMPAVPLQRLATKTGYDGFVVNANEITVYYEPTMNGEHEFTFRFWYGGDLWETRAKINASGYRSSGGSSGCDAGLGVLALLAAGGLLVLRKRKG